MVDLGLVAVLQPRRLLGVAVAENVDREDPEMLGECGNRARPAAFPGTARSPSVYEDDGCSLTRLEVVRAN